MEGRGSVDRRMHGKGGGLIQENGEGIGGCRGFNWERVGKRQAGEKGEGMQGKCGSWERKGGCRVGWFTKAYLMLHHRLTNNSAIFWLYRIGKYGRMPRLYFTCNHIDIAKISDFMRICYIFKIKNDTFFKSSFLGMKTMGQAKEISRLSNSTGNRDNKVFHMPHFITKY